MTIDDVLIWSAEAGYEEIVEALLKRGANANAVSGSGKSVYQHAGLSRQWGVCAILLEHGAITGHGEGTDMFVRLYGRDAAKRERDEKS